MTIDVWKYSDDSLRRQFLYDLQHDLRGQGALKKDKDYVEEVYLEKAAETTGKQRFALTRLRSLAIPLISTFLFALAGILLLQALDVQTPFQAVLAAFVAPAALFFVSEVSRNLVVNSRDTVTRPVYFSEDQFERKFEEIVTDAKCDKLVIIVDNLDRCSHELVVDTLSAIKTFLEPKGVKKCVFVIPCDDNAIRQHVKAAYRVFGDDSEGDGTVNTEQYVAEYLRKFFSASIKIDPFLPEEIEPYIEHLLSQMILTEDMPDQEIGDLVQMVGLLFRENPRQLKQFLNNLTSKYLLAKEREGGSSPQIHPPITDNKLFLAKVVAIETQFPEIYRQFSNDDNLFAEVHSAAVTPSRENEARRLLGKGKGLELLENFLRTSGHITADNPKAFFHLKQSGQEARIPNYMRFDMALRQGGIEEARKAYAEGNHESNAARTEVLIRDISDWSQKGYLSYSVNAVRVAIAARDFPSADMEYISKGVARALATKTRLLGSIHLLRDPNALLEMSEYALPDHRRTVQDAHINLLSTGSATQQPGQNIDDPLEDLVAASLVRHLDSLNSEQHSLLRSAMTQRDQVRPELLDILSSTQQATDAFIESTTLSKAVDKINVEALADRLGSGGDEERVDLTLEVLVRSQDVGDKVLGDATAEKLSDALQHAVNNGIHELFSYTTDVALKLGPLLDFAEPDHLAGLIAGICEVYQPAQQEQKVMLVKLMCRHYGRVTEDERNRINRILNRDFIPSVPAEHIAEILALHKELSYGDAPWEVIQERLSQRIAADAGNSTASELMEAIVTELVPNDLEYLMSVAKAVMDKSNAKRSVPLVDQALAKLPRNSRGKGLATPVLEGALSLSGDAGEPEGKRLLLEWAMKQPALHTSEFEAKLDAHIVELCTSGDSFQQVAWDTLDSGRENGAITEERYFAILRGVADWLVLQPASTPLQQPIPNILATIVSLKDHLLVGDDRRENMIQWLSERQDESLPAEERRQTLPLLMNFGPLTTAALRVLVPTLVSQAQNSPDEDNRDAIISALLDLYRANYSQDKDLWHDLNQYRLGLLKGDGSQKKVGRKLDRDMLKIRRDFELPRESEA